MATKLVPKPAGIPGKQLDIFDEVVNKQEQQEERKPVPPQNPNRRPDPNLTKGTFQAFRL